jgi:hypothetical protein
MRRSYSRLTLGWTNSVRASPVNFDLTISYDNVANAALAAGDMTGTAQFYTAPQNTDTFLALGGPINIGSLSLGDSFVANFIPTEPCFGLFVTSCGIGFSFDGKAQGFEALAFLKATDAPNTVPPTPILPITDNLIPTDPCFNGTVCSASGVIMAYDQPIQVGTWSVTISAETPLPASLPLFAGGLGAIGLLGWRRKRKAQAVT